jgi:hypothetical protein
MLVHACGRLCSACIACTNLRMIIATVQGRLPAIRDMSAVCRCYTGSRHADSLTSRAAETDPGCLSVLPWLTQTRPKVCTLAYGAAMCHRPIDVCRKTGSTATENVTNTQHAPGTCTVTKPDQQDLCTSHIRS